MFKIEKMREFEKFIHANQETSFPLMHISELENTTLPQLIKKIKRIQKTYNKRDIRLPYELNLQEDFRPKQIAKHLLIFHILYLFQFI